MSYPVEWVDAKLRICRGWLNRLKNDWPDGLAKRVSVCCGQAHSTTTAMVRLGSEAVEIIQSVPTWCIGSFMSYTTVEFRMAQKLTICAVTADA